MIRNTKERDHFRSNDSTQKLMSEIPTKEDR